MRATLTPEAFSDFYFLRLYLKFLKSRTILSSLEVTKAVLLFRTIMLNQLFDKKSQKISKISKVVDLHNSESPPR